jgi:hypothetical protein
MSLTGRFESLGHLNVWNQTFNTGSLSVRFFGGTLRLAAAYERVRIRAAETKWKHRRIDRLGDHRKILI